MLSTNAVPETVMMAALPWKSVREALDDTNNRTKIALERLLSNWEGGAADEFRSRIDLLYRFTEDLARYIQTVEADQIPQLAQELSQAQEQAKSIETDANHVSYEEWAETRAPWEMNDRPHYEHEQKKEKLLMAAIVGNLAHKYARFTDEINNNPPPTPAVETPGANANPPSGPLFDEPGMGPGMTSDGTPHAPAAAGSGATAEEHSIDADTPAAPATETPWEMGSDGGEEVGDGLYASTGGAGLGGASAAPAAAAPTGGTGAGAMGAGAAGLGVAGAGAAAATGSGGAGRSGAGAGRPGGPGSQMMANGGAKGATAGAKGGAAAGRPGASGMAGGRPGESSEEESAEDSNWLKETESYFSHFDPNAGPADEYDPASVREWERKYDHWKELKESGEVK